MENLFVLLVFVSAMCFFLSGAIVFEMVLGKVRGKRRGSWGRDLS